MYVKRYRSADPEPFVKGLPVHSSHVVNGEETFIAYHHLVYPDGRVTTELSPLQRIGDSWYIDQVGWHAGDWDTNCKSIGVCLIGNFNKAEPPEAQLQATKKLAAYYRQFNPKLRITSHKSDQVKTDCPGLTWSKWRRKIE
jgi:hypothetical protein